MGYYFVRRIGHETIEIMSVDDDDEDINDLDTFFWPIGTDVPRERREIEILAGPFTIEKLYKLYIKWEK
jgi:hypothetical protein